MASQEELDKVRAEIKDLRDRLNETKNPSNEVIEAKKREIASLQAEVQRYKDEISAILADSRDRIARLNSDLSILVHLERFLQDQNLDADVARELANRNGGIADRMRAIRRIIQILEDLNVIEATSGNNAP